ncbi:MAG: penicillin acylase family protein [Leptospiraceae bacterium]
MALPAKSRWIRIPSLIFIWLGALVFIGLIVRTHRIRYIPDPAAVTELERQAKRVTIRRDDFGVPHIHGKTERDVAFGLAYAHAEDDFSTIQAVVAASRGELSRLLLSKTSLQNDFYAGMFRINERTEETYEAQISPELKSVFQGYADGLNYYAARHPEKVDARFFPVHAIDLARGFVHKIPLFVGTGQELGKALAAEPRQDVSDNEQSGQKNETGLRQPLKAKQVIEKHKTKDDSVQDWYEAYAMVASNAHAVSRNRSADGIHRLNVNSHQPWDGPVAWYEAHLRSEDGFEMYGATFPGSPLIFVGHNTTLGWTHTVNTPDLVDLFRLETNSENSKYTLDGKQLELKKRNIDLTLDLFFFEISVSRTVFDTVFGPALETDTGIVAVRVAGLEKHAASAEQWYRMAKASSFAEWTSAMEMQSMPMFHTVYADARNIAYVYNAKLPVRKPGPDYSGIVPGNSRELLWTNYLDYDDLPAVINPPSGFVQNCNSTPFYTTSTPYNPSVQDNSQYSYIESRLTNRALRSLELFGSDSSISREEFLRYKFDRVYHPSAPIYQEAVYPVLERFKPENALEKQALEVLRNWDGTAHPESEGAMLALLTWRPIWKALVIERKSPDQTPDPVDTFRQALDYLLDTGTLTDPLHSRQKLIRGDTVLGMGGGPDVLNAMHMKDLEGWQSWTHPEWQKIYAGDSFILLVEFTPDGIQSFAAQPYGSSMNPESSHYDDQAPMFQKRILRRTYLSEEEIKFRTRKSYHPGQEN